LNNLKRSGFETYFPVIRAQKRIGGHRFEGSTGLFGLYAFVLIVGGRWYDLRWSGGVSTVILGHDGRPARVADEIIAALRAREVDGFVQLAPRPSCEFAPGDRLQIVQGAFIGHTCLFEGMTTRQRIDALLVVLGAERRVSLARSDVRRAIPQPS
jgi:transcriptional antiterminator RfaH